MFTAKLTIGQIEKIRRRCKNCNIPNHANNLIDKDFSNFHTMCVNNKVSHPVKKSLEMTKKLQIFQHKDWEKLTPTQKADSRYW